MSSQPNPYAPPSAHVEDVVDAGDSSAIIRQEHIKHEASVRSIGILYYLSGALTGFAALSIIAASFVGQAGGALTAGLGIAYLALSAGSVFLGRGIRSFRPWARITAIVLGFVGLLAFPVGTLINVYILYLLLAKKGSRIFQPDYPAIVAATPNIQYRTSIVVWIVLGLLVAGVAAMIFWAAAGR